MTLASHSPSVSKNAGEMLISVYKESHFSQRTVGVPQTIGVGAEDLDIVTSGEEKVGQIVRISLLVGVQLLRFCLNILKTPLFNFVVCLT